MANALQEQLIKMGLATEEQVRPAKKPARPDSAGGGKRGRIDPDRMTAELV